MRMKRFPQYTALRVHWRDITHHSQWHNAEQAKKAGALAIRSWGAFLDNKDRALRMVTDLSEDGEYDVKVIPWGAIERVVIMEEGVHGSGVQDEVSA